MRGTSAVNSSPTDYESMAKVYDEGRTLTLDQLAELRDVLTPYLKGTPGPILDLGSGTGIFAEAIAAWFNALVVGVEPSRAMRKQALAKGDGRVTYVGGEAEHIPLRDHTCDCAWLSTVLHHIRDRARCAGELRRVLQDAGRVLIRSGFGDRLEGVSWLRYFPAAQDLAAARWPTIEATAIDFATAGFEVEALHSIPEIVAPNLSAYHRRIAVRANSTLTLIDDGDFEMGVERLRQEAASASSNEPVVDRRDLLVLR
jgi:SAM-dependent methyltransferase